MKFNKPMLWLIDCILTVAAVGVLAFAFEVM